MTSTWRATAESWAVTYVEPLVDTARRLALDAAMTQLCAQRPALMGYWFAGVLSDHALTLPPADPWRSLRATIVVDGQVAHRRGPMPAEPVFTGAIGPAGPFGTVSDATDVIMVARTEPETDDRLAALSTGLDSISSTILAFAADGQDEVREVLALATEPSTLFSVASAALRWLAWRRRVYTGPDDALLLHSVANWMPVADMAVAGTDIPAELSDEIARVRALCQLADEDYYALQVPDDLS